MSGLLDGVDQRTRLAGQNRLELLLFRLGGGQLFGINVFKIQEVVPCPSLTALPRARPVVRGITSLRGKTIPIIDLALAVGRPPLPRGAGAYVIVTEYNRSVQGFMVNAVDRIVNMNWEEILPPPPGIERQSYLTAVTRVDDVLVEIIDVEKVLAEVIGAEEAVSQALVRERPRQGGAPWHVLVADDSSVARNQIKHTLDQIGVEATLVRDGRQALDQLRRWADEGQALRERLAMVISDVEMPEMDGYTLTAEIRKDVRFKDLWVLLHTSLSGVFNQAMVQKVGADRFVAKFSPDELAKEVMDRIRLRNENRTAA